MRGFSKAIITGNLTRDPELRTIPSGTNVCSFSVAVNRTFKVNGQNQESVSFIDCTAWGKLGEIVAQYGRKGTGVLVSGRLEQRSWDDKNTGQKRSRVEIVVEDFNFVGGDGARREDNAYGGGAAAAEMAASSAPTDVAPADVVPTDVPPDGDIDMGDLPF